MKNLLIGFMIVLSGIKSYATQAQIQISGNVADQCSIMVLSVPDVTATGNILAHVNASSVISVSLEIDCNQAGLDIKASSFYGRLQEISTTNYFDYSVELTGPNIVSGGVFQGSSLITETVIATTALGSPVGSELKVRPAIPPGPAVPGQYRDFITISVTSL